MQLSLFENDDERIVNVASVRQRSPFRYPGGKTWLIPKVKRWLGTLSPMPGELIEPFAGGASISLTAAAEQLVQHVTMVELDAAIASVWQTILSGDDGKWLAERILTFELTPEMTRDFLARTNLTLKEQAFQTILKNRVSRGGIMAPGAGLIKEGEAGKGLRSRWYPETLHNRVLDIAKYRERISFIHGDGLDILRRSSARTNAVFFIDPPYTASRKSAGGRLYTHSAMDHAQLFDIVAQLAGDFLMTYDNTEEVFALAKSHNFDTKAVAMKNTHHARMTELLIGRNLDWIR